MIAQPPVSVDEFYRFIQQNADRRFELIAGEIVEAVSSNRLSGLAARFIRPEEVHVYVPGEKVQVLTKTDILRGDPVLPGFELLLDRICRH